MPKKIYDLPIGMKLSTMLQLPMVSLFWSTFQNFQNNALSSRTSEQAVSIEESAASMGVGLPWWLEGWVRWFWFSECKPDHCKDVCASSTATGRKDSFTLAGEELRWSE